MLIHMHAAVDVKCRASDVTCSWGGNKSDNRSNLFRLPQSAKRDMLDQALLLLACERASHIRLYESGGDTVYRNVAVAHLACERFTEAGYSCFGGRVIGLSQISGGSYYRGNIDDASVARFHHRPQYTPTQTKYRLEIGFKDVIPFIILHPEQQVVPGNPCIIHQYGDIPELILHSFEDVFNLSRIIDIQGHALAFYIGLFHETRDAFDALPVVRSRQPLPPACPVPVQ